MPSFLDLFAQQALPTLPSLDVSRLWSDLQAPNPASGASIWLPGVTTSPVLTAGGGLRIPSDLTKGSETPAAGQSAAGGLRVPKAPTAPGGAVAPGTPTSADPQTAFIQQYGPVAQQIEQETGIPAGIMLGIAINEGAATRGTLASDQHNVFGIKATPDWQGGTISLPSDEIENGQRVSRQSTFRTYANPTESFRDFARVLQQPLYAAALQQRSNPEAFVRGLGAAGYATDPQWADKVLSIAGRAQQTLAQPQPWVGGQQPPQGAVPIATTRQGAIAQGLSQFNVGLDPADAEAACGPIAAAWFAGNFGRTPTAAEALDLGKQFGWNRERGAAGPQSIVQVLGGMGIQATQMAPDPASVAREISAGRPVIIDTPGHYYQITDYNPATQQFQFGDAVGRGRWARLDDLSQFGFGAARTAIVVRQ